MKRSLIFLLAVILTVSMTACGGSSYTDSSDYEVSTAPMVAPNSGGGNITEQSVNPGAGSGGEAVLGTTENTATEGRKIIKHQYMTLESTAFEQDLEAVLKVIYDMGGYVDSQSIEGTSINYYGDEHRQASINARIPSQKGEEAGNAIAQICNVTSHSSSSDDITDSYFDSETRLNTLVLQEERLLEILTKAEKLEDIIQLEQAISQVRYEIESLTAALNRMDKQVEYSYLDIEVYEVIEYQKIEENFVQRLSGSFSRSWKNLTYSIEDVLFNVIENGPSTIIYLSFWGVIFFLGYKVLKKLGVLKNLKFHKKPKE